MKKFMSKFQGFDTGTTVIDVLKNVPEDDEANHDWVYDVYNVSLRGLTLHAGSNKMDKKMSGQF